MNQGRLNELLQLLDVADTAKTASKTSADEQRAEQVKAVAADIAKVAAAVKNPYPTKTQVKGKPVITTQDLKPALDDTARARDYQAKREAEMMVVQTVGVPPARQEGTAIQKQPPFPPHIIRNRNTISPDEFHNWPPDIQDHFEGSTRRVDSIKAEHAAMLAARNTPLSVVEEDLAALAEMEKTVAVEAAQPYFEEPDNSAGAGEQWTNEDEMRLDDLLDGEEDPEEWFPDTLTHDEAQDEKRDFDKAIHPCYYVKPGVAERLQGILEDTAQKKYSVLIGVATNAKVLNQAFAKSLNEMEKPDNAQVQYVKGYSVADMRNRMALDAMKDGYTHIYMLDSDMVYPSDALTRLLAHDKDIVSGFACRSYPPHDYIYLKVPSSEEDNPYKVGIPMREGEMVLPFGGLHPVAAVGGAGTLIKTQVFAAMEYPFFSQEQFSKEGKSVGEDIFFCVNAAKSGFQAYLDTDMLYGHIIEMVVTPVLNREKGLWGKAFTATES